MEQKQQVNFNKNSINTLIFYSQQLGKQFRADARNDNWECGGKCPFHSDTKVGSFRVNIEHGAFKCYSCGAQGGDVVDFLRLLHGWSFKQAVCYLEGSEGCQPERKAEQPTPEPPSESDRESNRLKLTAEWERAEPANQNHAYLVKKRITAHGIRQHGRNLVIPVFDCACSIRGIQNIGENGFKWFSSGSCIKGNYFTVGKAGNKTLLICEGLATGITLNAETGNRIIVAFNAGNLEPVAIEMRNDYPNHQIIIAADNDRFTKDGTLRADNPGLDAATKAAERINAKLAVPEFPDGVLGSDFNDLANLGVLV